MTYLGLFNKSELRDLIIDRIIDRELDQLVAIKNKDKWDIFTYITNVTNYTINMDQSYNYWMSNYHKYCIDTIENYLDQWETKDSNKFENMLEDMINDKSEFRDYIDLARDHIDINDDTKEIVF